MTSESVEDRPAAARAIMHMGGKPPESEPLPCPRCQSTNTKFCYYNNYNLSQPRYFCKSCRRYWTRGGTLRNVPVGGGTRKSSSLKRSRSTATTSSVAPSSSSSSTLTYDPAPADPLSAVPGSTPEMGKIQDLNQAISMPAEPVYTVPGFLSEMGHGVKIQDLNQTIPGGFTSLLETQQMSGFGSFGGFGLEPGSGIRSMGFSLAPWGWPMVETGGGNDGEGGGDGMVGSGGGVSGCNTWQVSGVEGGGIGDGDCFGWPDLAISTPSNGGVS